MKVPKEMIMRLALATLIGMPLLGILIGRFSDRIDLAEMIIGYKPWYIQIIVGIVIGVAAGFSARWLISRPFMNEVSIKYANLIGQFKLNWSEILFVSFCAGVGEEILFRGAIQPLLGVVLTAMVFVAIHGYLNPMDWRMSTYGLMMIVFIILIGLAAEWAGLVSAMIAHTIIDVILLLNLQTATVKLPDDSHTSSFPNSDDDVL